MSWEQLELALSMPVLQRRAPALQSPVRIFRKYPYLHHPGAEVEYRVKVQDGIMVKIVPAGELPKGAMYGDQYLFSTRSRASKYDRWVIATRFNKYSKLKYAVVTMDYWTTWKLLSECESSVGSR